MKIFEKDYKINFVDDNNVFVGFDYSQSCCENFGYRILDLSKQESKQEITPDEKFLAPFQFDKTFHEEVNHSDDNRARFKLRNGRKIIFLEIYNQHNGYYGHGFDFCDGETVIFSGCL